MPKNPKSKRARYQVTFPAFKVFSQTDMLGIDFLRLMGVCNDIANMIDGIKAFDNTSSDPLVCEIARCRMTTQHRLWMSILHEGFIIVEDMGTLPKFKDLEKNLDAEGKKALETLRNAKRNRQVFSMLQNMRNKATFHYDRSEFQKALKKMKNTYGENLKRTFVYEPIDKYRGRTYYTFAEDLRNTVSFGLKPQELLQKEISQILEWQEALLNFLNSGLNTFAKIQNLEDYFHLEK